MADFGQIFLYISVVIHNPRLQYKKDTCIYIYIIHDVT